MTLLSESATRPIYLKEHEECDAMFTPMIPVYMNNIYGKVRISVCERCGYEDVECLHLYNEVNIQEKTIKCLLCGG